MTSRFIVETHQEHLRLWAASRQQAENTRELEVLFQRLVRSHLQLMSTQLDARIERFEDAQRRYMIHRQADDGVFDL